MDGLENQEVNPDLLYEHFARLLEERVRLGETIGRLQVALRDAIRDTTRVRDRIVETGPAGNTYEVEWTDQVRAWALLCHLDLTGMEPAAYAQH